jgi:Bacterial extracellular solute-binding protein
MRNPPITRRRFPTTTGAAGLGTLAVPNVITRARAQAKNELVFVGFGGSYQDGQTKAFFEPFEKETGIKVIQTTGVDIAKLRAQVQSKNVEWDLISIPDRLRYTAVKDGLLTPLNYNVINAKDIIPQLVTEFAVGGVTIAMQNSYSTKAYPPGKQPVTWQDFWDATKFPGPRGLYNAPTYIVEFALIADGVPKDKLYPLDVPRALKSLDRVKPHVKVWWTQFPQPGVLLKSGEITMTPWTRRELRRRSDHVRGLGGAEERPARRQRNEVHQLRAPAEAAGRADQVHRVRPHQPEGHAGRQRQAEAAAPLGAGEHEEGVHPQRRLVGAEPRQGERAVERVAPEIEETR